MTITQSIYHRLQRYRTLHSDHILALPIVILMPHSSCNCQCVMCDIWKDNKNLKQLTQNDITGLLATLKKMGTQQVVMSGGEAILNPNFFEFCRILKTQGIKVTLLSTGLTLKKNAEELSKWVNDIIISLDGPEAVHNLIRNIPTAFQKLKESVQYLKEKNPKLRITSRTVIHRLNFRYWQDIIDTAKEIGVDQVSFLPADVSSHAFNREVLWSDHRQHEILPDINELKELKNISETIIRNNTANFDTRFIAESPTRINKIYEYYAAFYGLNNFPYKKCNAPWVSTVIEADGTVRPCFFHKAIGNIREQSLEQIINGEQAIRFRKDLDIDSNATCVKCVCYLNLSPGTKI
jgi:MoaA/NifB/PqqE/SkfB family radical SAM enzyme